MTESATLEFGTNLKEKPKVDEKGFITYTLEPGRRLRIIGKPGKQIKESDVPLDIISPEGLVIKSLYNNKGQIIKGNSPDKDSRWVHVGVIKTPDSRIQGGYIGWSRDEHGEFSIPIMHPDYVAPEEPPNLGL